MSAASNTIESGRPESMGTLAARPSPSHMRNLRIHFGIDEDLKMILEMDPSIIDLGVPNMRDYSPNPHRVVGLPPKSGGYVFVRKLVRVFVLVPNYLRYSFSLKTIASFEATAWHGRFYLRTCTATAKNVMFSVSVLIFSNVSSK